MRSMSVYVCVWKKEEKSERQNAKTNARERETDIRKTQAACWPVCVLVSEPNSHRCAAREREREREPAGERESERQDEVGGWAALVFVSCFYVCAAQRSFVMI